MPFSPSLLRRARAARALALVPLLCFGPIGCNTESPPGASDDGARPPHSRAGSSASGAASTERPSIILISIDTLRADRLPAYGYDAIETPAFDILARDGVLFENAYSHAPLTLPSHASIFSGLWPNAHGVRDNMGYRLDDAGLPHLPELFAELGYRTGAFVSSFVLRAETGMGRGFEVYDDRMPLEAGSGQDGLQRAGGETARLALEWLDQGAGPAFLFVHFFEPHTPYSPPSPFAERYASPYDAEIATVDAVVGQLLDGLRQRGLYDESLVVLLSDHGESLGEHGEDEHGIFVYRATQHVPLLLKLPVGSEASENAPGLRIPEAVQLVDVLPTLLDGIGRGSDLPAELDGRSLLPLVADPTAFASFERPLYTETYYPRLYFGWSELRSVILGSKQFIDSPQPELYDLAADPAQQNDILAEERRTYAALRGHLRAIEPGYLPPAEVDADTRKQLVSLGYVGGARNTSTDQLPAPKTQIGLLGELKRAHTAHAEGRNPEAAAIYRSVLEANPAMLFAWEQLGRMLAASGQREQASEAYRRALDLSGGAPHLAIALAEEELALGRLEEAAILAAGTLDHDPQAADLLLSRIAVIARDGEEAEARAQSAIDREPESTEAHLALARARVVLGRLDDAAAGLESALGAAEKEPVLGFFQLRADLFARAGRTDEAILAFGREIELFPGNARAHAGLALLHATLGDLDAARGIFDRLLEGSPSADAYVTAIRFFATVGDTNHAGDLQRRAAGRFPGDPRFAASP